MVYCGRSKILCAGSREDEESVELLNLQIPALDGKTTSATRF
jgi:hypothetical protein